MTPPRIFATTILLLAALAGARSARADLDPVTLAGSVPADVDVLIAVEGGAEMRRTPVGGVVFELAALAGFVGSVGPAWGELADALGATGEAAFDDLLGGRVVYLKRNPDDAPSSWALMSRVSPRTAERLRDRLRAAPRDILGGRPVLTIDGGRLSLLLGPEEDGRRVLLIGPGTARSLFDELGRTLDRGPERALADTERFARVARLGRRGDAFLLARAAAEGGPVWVAALADVKPERIDTSFLVSLPSLVDRADSVRTWSRETFDELADDAFVLVLDLNDVGDGSSAMPGLGLPFTLPDEVCSLMSDRLALLVRPGADAPIELALAVETLDINDMAGPADALVEGLVRRMPGGDGLGDRVAALRSTPASAIRTVDLGRALPALDEFGWEAGPWLSWRGRKTDEPCDPGQAPGWWTVGVGTRAVDELSEAVARNPEGVSLPWLSLGVVRPGATLRALERAGVPSPDALAPLARVREIAWEALRMSEGVVVGLGRVELESGAWAPAPEPGADADAVAGYREGSPGGGSAGDGGRR
jgi:hypothetical protein